MSEIRVPDGWRKIHLGSIILKLTDYTANGSFESLKNNVQYYNNEEYSVLIRTTDLNKTNFTPQRFTDYKGWNFLKKTALYGNEILIANVGSVGKVYRVPIYPKPMTLAPNMYLLKFIKEINEDFLFYILSSKNFKTNLLKQLGSTTLQAINKDNLRNILIFLPKSKKEQKKIAEILSEVDRAITLTKELIEKNKRLKTALMQDLLSYGIDEKGQIRSPQTHKFKPSPLGDIPVEWECIDFDNILNIIDGDRGSNYPTEVDFYQDEYCMFLNAKNVTKNGFDFSEKSFITKEKNSKLGKGKLKRNDFVLTTRGTVGNIAYFNQYIPFENLRINSGMVILRPLNQDIIGSFFYEFLKSDFFNSQKNQVIFGSAQPQLTVKQIQKFILIFPKSKTEQQKIADILSSQDEKIEKLKNKLTKLNHLKTSLMQDLLSGKVRVNKLLESKQ